MNASPSYPVRPLLEAMIQRGASDLHLKPGSPPGYRIDGRLFVDREVPALGAADTLQVARQMASTCPGTRLEQPCDADFTCTAPGVARFRVRVSRLRGSVSLVVRRIPIPIPDLSALGLPPAVPEFALQERGLVLVTGPAGAGRTTTLAALVQHRNQAGSGHVVTLEDPIEFVHADADCYITQREIGVDCASFPDGLARALRQDPDVLMIGELPDAATVDLALTAAESGQLVLAGLWSGGAASPLERLLELFPADARERLRLRLGATLRGVLRQTLVRRTGGGRVAACEVIVVSDAVRSCIRENKLAQIANLVQAGAELGMQTLDKALAELVRQGTVSQDEGTAHSSDPREFHRELASGGTPLRALPRSPLPARGAQAIPGPIPPAPVAAAPFTPPAAAQELPPDVRERLRHS